MDKKKRIGIAIRTMRKSRNMTQEDLARAICQSPSSVTMYETGRRAPNYETLEALADTFNVPISSIVSDGNEYISPPEHAATPEVRIISAGIDRMPKERREQAIRVLQAAFAEYSDYFKEENHDDT